MSEVSPENPLLEEVIRQLRDAGEPHSVENAATALALYGGTKYPPIGSTDESVA
jgi:hypothetical protein